MIHSTHRFHGRSSLRFVYQHGQQVRGEFMSLRTVHNARITTWRVAVVVSRKVSKSAVVRNRIRRRVFEIVRAQSGSIAGRYDLVFTIYAEAVAQLPAADLQHMVQQQLRKATVLKASAPEGGHAIVEGKETLR